MASLAIYNVLAIHMKPGHRAASALACSVQAVVPEHCRLHSADGCGLSFALSRTIITLQSTLQLCGAQQKPDVLSCLQDKMPGPPHRARNALLYMDLEAEDLTKPEVARLITMAGIDLLP